MAQPLEHVEYLSKEIGARPAGTEEEQNAALYIADQLQKEANFHAEIEEFTSSSNFPFVQAICCAVIVVVTVLAMFVPVLVVPWQLVEDLGAKVRSDAPRDYYLYVGAKKRLFSTFAALGVFMMMFVLSLYFGNDVLDILKNYLYYLIPLVFTSAMYAFIYSNNFHEAMKLTIQARFEDYKGSYRKR